MPEGETQKPRSGRAALPTIREAADRYIKTNAPRWRNSKTAINWHGSLKTYANPVFGDVRIDRITQADVLAALSIWTTKPSIARKLRQRLYGLCSPMGAGVTATSLPSTLQVRSSTLLCRRCRAVKAALPGIALRQEAGSALETVEASGASLSSRLCLPVPRSHGGALG